MDGPERRRIRVLRLTPSIGETSAPYNQFSLAACDRQDITLCTYFRPGISVPEQMNLFAGDGSLAGFLRALRAALTTHRYDVIHAHLPNVSFLTLLGIMATNRRLMRYTVHTVHSSFSNYGLKNRLMLAPVLAFYRRVVFCSRSSLDSFPVAFRRLAGRRACVVQNGVDVDRIDRSVGIISEYGSDRPFRVVSIGRLIPLKQPLSILSAFRAAGGDAGELVFVGEGNLREQIVAESRRLGLETRVIITGLIERDSVYKQLATADLFVSASIVEGLPVSVLEAMACRCPVVLSDIPPHREIAEAVGSIPLVAPGDMQGFAREIQAYREMLVDERLAIGEACRRAVVAKFSLSMMHKRYDEVYAQIVAGE